MKQRTLKFGLAAVLLILAGLFGSQAFGALQNPPVETDPVATLAVAAVQSTVSNVLSGAEPLDGILLDREINNWSDVGLTFTDAVRLNDPIVVVNDGVWSGWTTTGNLSGTNIVLATDEYLLSPMQTNGVADWVIAENGSGRINWTIEVVTNGVSIGSPPYYGTNGQVRVTAGEPMPMMTPSMTIYSLTIYGYENLTEATAPKYVSAIRRTEVETHPADLTRKIYVDATKAAAIASASASLSAYAANPDKTVRGAELRLGNMWVVSPADSSGDRFIMSGGEISGDGELVGTTNEFVIAKNDYPLMSFTSDSSGLYCTNFIVTATSSNSTWTLYVATNGVHSAPFAEWTDNIAVGEWSRVLTYEAETYPTVSNGTYTLKFTVPSGDTCYVRAMQPEGDSVVEINADVFFLKHSKLLINDATGGVWRIEASTNGTVIAIQE